MTWSIIHSKIVITSSILCRCNHRCAYCDHRGGLLKQSLNDGFYLVSFNFVHVFVQSKEINIPHYNLHAGNDTTDLKDAPKNVCIVKKSSNILLGMNLNL